MTADIDVHKHHKVIAAAGIPVEPPEELFKNNGKKAVIILALDHAQEIEKFLKEKLGKGSIIVHLLPTLKKINV